MGNQNPYIVGQPIQGPKQYNMTNNTLHIKLKIVLHTKPKTNKQQIKHKE